MKLLLENWRKFLNEDMKTLDNLPDNVVIAVVSDPPNMIDIYYAEAANPRSRSTDPEGNILITHGEPNEWELRRLKSIRPEYGGPFDAFGPCNNAWRVMESEAQSGWGPLLYDIAIEWATVNGSGLVSDRLDVSDEATAVWDRYLKNRSGVENHQLDDLDNTLTPEEHDNCVQQVSLFDPKYDKFSDSPLSKRYTKEPTTIDSLGDKLKIL